MVYAECVKHRHTKFVGGFVFCHVITGNAIIPAPLIIAYNHFFANSVGCIGINHALNTYNIYSVAFITIPQR